MPIGDIDEEDPLPREQVGEDAARENAGCGPEAADGSPGAERDVALAALAEGRRQDRERRGRDRRRSEPLQPASEDERFLAPREPAEQRPQREDNQAGHEDDPAPEDVRETAAEQEEATEDQRVGADHPLKVLLGEAQVLLN